MPKYQARHYVTIVYDFEVEAEDLAAAEDVAFNRMAEGEGFTRDETPGHLGDALELFGWGYADLDDETYVDPRPLS